MAEWPMEGEPCDESGLPAPDEAIEGQSYLPRLLRIITTTTTAISTTTPSPIGVA
jgi:hypothetical protein